MKTHSIPRRDWLKTAGLSLASLSLFAEMSTGVEAAGPKTILIIAGSGDGNIGTIAHTTGILNLFQRRFPGTKILLWKGQSGSRYASQVVELIGRHYPKVEVVTGKIDGKTLEIQSDSIRDAFDAADVFVHGSGAGVHRPDALRAWSRHTDKPFGIFGTAFSGGARGLKDMLDKAAFVFPRESISLKKLADTGIAGEHVRVAPDAAFAAAERNDELADAFMAENGLEPEKYICVVPRLRWSPPADLAKMDPKKREKNETAKEIDHAKAREAMIAWIDQTGHKVLLCPEMIYQVGIMDELLIDPLPEKYKKFVRKHEYWMPDEAASIYARARVVLSFECHSPIIAFGMGTPAFYLRQPEDSIKGQMYHDLDMGDWMFEIEDTTGRRIAERLMEVHADYDAAQEKIKGLFRRLDVVYTGATDIIRKSRKKM